jgi:hypothetical protein
MLDRWGQDPLSMICDGRGADANGGNSRKQGGKEEKDREHDGDETSRKACLLRLFIYLRVA